MKPVQITQSITSLTTISKPSQKLILIQLWINLLICERVLRTNNCPSGRVDKLMKNTLCLPLVYPHSLASRPQVNRLSTKHFFFVYLALMRYYFSWPLLLCSNPINLAILFLKYFLTAFSRFNQFDFPSSLNN